MGLLRFLLGEAHTEPEDAAAYQDASDGHDQSECGGTWRAHSDPQERLDCIKTSDSERRGWFG